jgi:hypothetical protein
MADAQGNIILEVSDQRLKENVATLTGSLDKILGLRGVSYAWKDKDRFGDQTEIGFLAQEVDAVVPEVVRKGGSYWSLNTKNLLAVVVEAMKEMWLIVNGNQDRIEELEARVLELEGAGKQSTDAEESTADQQDEEPTEDDTQSTVISEETGDIPTESAGDEDEIIVQLAATTATSSANGSSTDEQALPTSPDSVDESVPTAETSDQEGEVETTSTDADTDSEQSPDPQETNPTTQTTAEELEPEPEAVVSPAPEPDTEPEETVEVNSGE